MKKKLFIGLAVLALVVGLSACDASNKTSCICENGSRWIGSSDSVTPAQDSQGSSSNMSESQKALSILNAASDIQYVEHEKDELGYDIYNTYYITTTIKYDQKHGNVTVERQSTPGHSYRVPNENIKVLDKLEKDIVMDQTLTSIWVENTGVLRLFLTTETYQQLVAQGFKL